MMARSSSFLRITGRTEAIFIFSRLNGTDWSIPEKLSGEVNSLSWEGSASLSADEHTLYFSSERPGGLGGKDIYRASLLKDGSWGEIKNLGAEVNTSFDDDAPFIHPDGKTLLFSSKGRNSIGGYDVFSSVLKNNGEWSTALNLGYPVNTTDEDIYFVLSADGNRGYYASGKAGGYGLADLYVVDMPENYNKPVVAMIKGTTMLDEKMVTAEISVKITDLEKEYGSFKSSVYGNYLFNLPPGHCYEITYKMENYPDQVQTLDLSGQKDFREYEFQINFSVRNIMAQKD
ncbi:MAG TPA: hypothetical protein VF868_16610 [Bacteroidia bacterium]|jgi:hypothetical protein